MKSVVFSRYIHDNNLSNRPPSSFQANGILLPSLAGSSRDRRSSNIGIKHAIQFQFLGAVAAHEVLGGDLA
jgi:hypothetical protein